MMTPLSCPTFQFPPPFNPEWQRAQPDFIEHAESALTTEAVDHISPVPDGSAASVTPEKSILSAQFHAAFDQNCPNKRMQDHALYLLSSMSPNQLVELPLISGACPAYRKIIGNAMQQVLELAPAKVATDDVEAQGSTEAAASSGEERQTFENTFSDPNVYLPLDAEKGVFSKQFYRMFHKDHPHELSQHIGLMILNNMSVDEQARLPLFNDACDGYYKIVFDAIRLVLASSETDAERLSTKRQILACASSHGYLKYPTVFSNVAINLDQVNLMGLKIQGFDFSGASLRGTNFSFTDMRAVDLRRTNIEGAIFFGARLDEATFRHLISAKADISYSSLEDVRLRNIDLHGLDLRGVNFKNASFDNVLLTDANLSGSDFEGVDLSKMELVGINFEGASLRGSNLTSTRLIRVNLNRTNLDAADLQNSTLSNVTLNSATMRKSKLRNCAVTKVNFCNSNLRGADLSGMNLSGLDLRGVDLRGANLRGANLAGTNLAGANLIGVDLTAVDLSGANLQGARLTDANLRNANLRGARLEGTDMSGLDLDGTNLSDARVSGARFRKTLFGRATVAHVNFSGTDLSGANFDGGLLWGVDFTNANLSNARMCNLSFSDTSFSRTTLAGVVTNNPGLVRHASRGAGKTLVLNGLATHRPPIQIAPAAQVQRPATGAVQPVGDSLALKMPEPIIPKPKASIFSRISTGIKNFISGFFAMFWPWR